MLKSWKICKKWRKSCQAVAKGCKSNNTTTNNNNNNMNKNKNNNK